VKESSLRPGLSFWGFIIVIHVLPHAVGLTIVLTIGLYMYRAAERVSVARVRPQSYRQERTAGRRAHVTGFRSTGLLGSPSLGRELGLVSTGTLLLRGETHSTKSRVAPKSPSNFDQNAERKGLRVGSPPPSLSLDASFAELRPEAAAAPASVAADSDSAAVSHESCDARVIGSAAAGPFAGGASVDSPGLLTGGINVLVNRATSADASASQSLSSRFNCGSAVGAPSCARPPWFVHP
jgi:hypothetical protein